MLLQLFCDGHFCAACRLNIARLGGSQVGASEFVTSGRKEPELRCVQLHCLVPAVGGSLPSKVNVSLSLLPPVTDHD